MVTENQERNSAQNKIDNTYLETAIFNLFTIDLVQFIHVKAVLAKEFHIQPSEIEKMPAWEYELFMKEINNLNYSLEIIYQNNSGVKTVITNK